MGNEKRLGLGLDAIFGKYSENKIENIAVKNIITASWQPRKNFSQNALNELAASVKLHGVLQPILVKKINNNYEIVAGERRFRASLIAQKETIPAIVVDFDKQTLLEISMIENLQRTDLNPVEKAEGFAFLIDTLGINHEQLAIRLGMHRSVISNYLRINKLSQEIKDKIVSGKITFGHAKILANKKNANELIDEIVDKKLSVRAVEQRIEEIECNYNVKDNQKNQILNKVKKAEIDQLQELIFSVLKVPVQICIEKNKGSIKLEFNNLDELDKIIAKICM